MRYIWLASFPRSGNTFIRNVFHHVYGLNSYEFETDINDRKDNENDIVLIKTHNLPFQLSKYNPKKDKVIYLVRDGRDAICSLAHKRKNMIALDSDLYMNFKEASYAERGSFFGGWDFNTQLWLAEDPIIVRFEDLVVNPQKVFEEIEKHIKLPKPNWQELPTFEKQKQGESKYGQTQLGLIGDKNQVIDQFSHNFFRKGKIGNWINEMPVDLQNYFWDRCSEVLLALGYNKDGSISSIDDLKVKAIIRNKSLHRRLHNKLIFWNLELKYMGFKNMIKKILGININRK